MESRSIDVDALEKSIEGKLCSDSPLPAKCCIFKVPEVLRRHKPEAYQPDVVSIGPFHHQSGKNLQHMENVKHWYLSKLLSRVNMSLKTLIQLIDVVEFGKEARTYYADPLNGLDQNGLLEMMILDGCFLLELFVRSSCKKPQLNTNEETKALIQMLDLGNDPIFNQDCMVQHLCHDLLLLENQLPWFVLNQLYSLTMQPDEPSLVQLVLGFFSRLASLAQHCACYSSYKHDNAILHILDLIRSTIVDPLQLFISRHFVV